MGWEELIDSLDELETKREYDGYFCSVKNAVIILILGSLCDLKNIKRIHEWASAAHVQEYLKKEFNIQRVPCYWWLLSLLSLITPESLNKCMMRWVSEIAPRVFERIQKEEKEKKESTMNTSLTLSVDGKEIRSTEKMDIYEEPIHIVSAHISELKMTLAQETVAGKSNEIPAMQNLIKSLEIEGYMVVADALNCQIDTAQAIIEKKADYLLCAKDNQPTLKSDIEDYVQTAALRAKMDSAQTSERGHGRKEIRTAFTTDDVSWQVGGRQWPALKCIGAVCTQFEDKNGKKSEQWHYYISSRNLSAKELLHHARQEWSVETMHWLLDVLFGEDGCRIQTKTAQQNLNMVRKLGSQHNEDGKQETKSKIALIALMFKSLLDPYQHLHILGKN